MLVIEDNADAAESMELLLTAQGHEVRTAGDGLAAAEAIQPDVALVDLGLPRMDGFEVATEKPLRRRPAHRCSDRFTFMLSDLNDT